MLVAHLLSAIRLDRWEDESDCCSVLGLHGRVSVAGERLQGWLLGEAARSFPGSDQLLAQAEPISASGNTCGRTDLRGETCSE